VYSVIVPLPSVVVVVVVVSETCPHANGATTANAILKSTFLIVLSLSCLVAVAVSLSRAGLILRPDDEFAAILDSRVPYRPDASKSLFNGLE
jgi:hypothetical protein